MKKYHKLKVTSAMLLTAGLVATVLNPIRGDVKAPTQPNLSVGALAKSIKSEKDIVKKHDYLPDILGRIGYAIFKAEQTQIEHIRNYQLPDVSVTYSDGTNGFIRNIVNTIRNDEKSLLKGDINNDKNAELGNTGLIEPPVFDAPTLPEVPKPVEPPVFDAPTLPEVPNGWDDFPTDIPDDPIGWDDIPSDLPPNIPDEPHPEPLIPEKPIERTESDTEVKFRQEVVKVKQGQKIVYDNTLEKGKQRLVEGTPGQIVKSYKDTYYKGELSHSTLVEEETTVEPIQDILYIGSKVSEKATTIVDFNVGDKFKEYEIIKMKGDIEGFIGKDYRELMNESEDVRFQKAQSSIDASYIARDPHEEEPFDQTYMWLGVGDEMVTVFNSTNFVDKTKVNQYLVNYINMDRETKGLKKLKYDETLQPLTEVRAQEMADYGHIRYQGKPHTRPDGTPWLTVLDQLPTDYKSSGFGENMLAYSVLSNPYQLVSEQWIAKRLFEQWKSSPPHYEAMMDPNYTRTAVSFKLTTRTGAKSDNNTNWMIGAELFA